MNNKKQEKHQDGSNSNKKESTDHDEATTSSTHQVVYHSDVCAICQENVSMLDTTTFRIYTCCGKVMHKKCWNDLHGSKLSLETKNRCPWCRAKNATEEGSKEDIKRLRKWSQKNKRWAQCMLAGRYDRGMGVPQDDKRAFALLWKFGTHVCHVVEMVCTQHALK